MRLLQTKEIVVDTFKSESEYVRDGMDISICKIPLKGNNIEWSGAFNPLYLIKNRSNEIQRIAADRQPVGVSEFTKDFTNHVIPFEAGDRIYLFTDGFVDQFGGANGKKYKHTKFEQLLLSQHKVEMKSQFSNFSKEFEDWRKAHGR